DAYGLPTAADEDVIIGLIQLTKDANNFTEPRVNFTRYELLRLLGWPHDGRHYRRLDDSLSRWVSVSLHYDKAWWRNDVKTWITEKFQ
ncbi:MAG TPA: replication initiator protein A, partial [Gemmata sp.]|nr:replication initiator protein A [Gemmata sp.]